MPAGCLIHYDVLTIEDASEIRVSPLRLDRTLTTGADQVGAGCGPMGERGEFPHEAETGCNALSWLVDYFYRIIVDPPANDFGVVAAAKSLPLLLRSRFFEPISLEGLSATGADGLALVGLPALPATIPPLGKLAINHQATVSGPVQIEAHYTFHFDVAAADYAATGVRGLLFAFAPDWSAAPVVKRGYATVIEAGPTGDEARHAQRPRPLHALSYRVLTAGHGRLGHLQLFLHRLGEAPVAVPLWTDPAYLAAEAPAGSLALEVETSAGRRFRADGHALVFASEGRTEIVELTAVEADRLTLAKTTTATWPAGTAAYPLLFGRLTDLPRLALLTDELAATRLEFEETLS